MRWLSLLQTLEWLQTLCVRAHLSVLPSFHTPRKWVYMVYNLNKYTECDYVGNSSGSNYPFLAQAISWKWQGWRWFWGGNTCDMMASTTVYRLLPTAKRNSHPIVIQMPEFWLGLWMQQQYRRSELLQLDVKIKNPKFMQCKLIHHGWDEGWKVHSRFGKSEMWEHGFDRLTINVLLHYIWCY
jgi:hypothetical protein